MVNSGDVDTDSVRDTVVVAMSSPLSSPSTPPLSSPREHTVPRYYPSPAASPAAYMWSPPVVLEDEKQYYRREGSAGFWIVYLRGANESFSQVVDLVRRVFEDAAGVYLVERKARPDRRAIVDIWLCFVHQHSVTSVMSKDIWGRKGAQGAVVHIEWPRFHESRKAFFTSSVGKVACTGAECTEGSFAGLMEALQKASDAESERMRQSRNRIRRRRVMRGRKGEH